MWLKLVRQSCWEAISDCVDTRSQVIMTVFEHTGFNCSFKKIMCTLYKTITMDCSVLLQYKPQVGAVGVEEKLISLRECLPQRLASYRWRWMYLEMSSQTLYINLFLSLLQDSSLLQVLSAWHAIYIYKTNLKNVYFDMFHWWTGIIRKRIISQKNNLKISKTKYILPYWMYWIFHLKTINVWSNTISKFSYHSNIFNELWCEHEQFWLKDIFLVTLILRV